MARAAGFVVLIGFVAHVAAARAGKRLRRGIWHSAKLLDDSASFFDVRPRAERQAAADDLVRHRWHAQRQRRSSSVLRRAQTVDVIGHRATHR